MAQKCHHEIDTKIDYPGDFICQKCQSIWKYRKGMKDTELIKFPLVVRRILEALHKHPGCHLAIVEPEFNLFVEHIGKGIE